MLSMELAANHPRLTGTEKLIDAMTTTFDSRLRDLEKGQRDLEKGQRDLEKGQRDLADKIERLGNRIRSRRHMNNNHHFSSPAPAA